MIFKKLLKTNKKLAQILIKAQKEVFSSVLGKHIAKHKGNGYDFAELRPYESGDDIKHIDWIISSKLTQPHVKVFFQQKELNITIVPLLTASLNFGTTRLKKDTVAEISALIALSAIKQGDSYSAHIANQNLFLVNKKTKQLFAVRNLVETILEYNVLGKHIFYKKIFNNLYNTQKQKSLIFLIGDFFNTKNLNIKALSLKHEIVIIMVRDRFEENPPILDNLSVIDSLSNNSAEIELNAHSIKKYKNKLQKEQDDFLQILKKSRVKFLKIYNDESPADKILSFMAQR